MLRIVVPAREMFDEEKNEFLKDGKDTVLQLEHSLVSISKWESRWHKAFLKKRAKTNEEIIDYIRCMTITQNVDPDVYARLTDENLEQINAYISDSMTATYIPEDKNGTPSKEVATSELIYYWMVSFGIPLECQKWHLNRLMTLIKVFNFKNSSPKKRSKKELAAEYDTLNKKRKKALNTSG